MKFLSTIFILFFFEFAMGQIPGTPSLNSTNQIPRVYTHSITSPNSSLITAHVSAQIINTAQNPIIQSGVLWGSGIPTLANHTGKSIDGVNTGGPFTSIAEPLPNDVDSINFVAYATTIDGKTYYGKVLTISRTATSPFTGRVWMSHNLGATAMPKNPATPGDTASYGNLYQWGRTSDGHEIIYPLKAATYNANGSPATGTAFSETTTSRPYGYVNLAASNDKTKFIIHQATPYDWNRNGETTLWQATGINNPCPTGFRVPSSSEFSAETSNFSSLNSSGALNSFLKLPVTGYRANGGPLADYTSYEFGYYWTSTVNSTNSNAVVFRNTGTSISTTTATNRVRGLAIRCIQGQPSSGGTAVITITRGISSGTMTASVAISGVTQTINATVSTPGTYNIFTAPVNGVSFRGSGTISATGPIVLTASGTPLVGTFPPASSTYVTNTSPSSSFTRTIEGWTTNGTAVVNSYTRINPTQTVLFENPISTLTETLSADVTTPGSYNLTTTTNNGVKFTASGTFTQTGIQNIVFNATGTALTTGTFTFTSNTTPVATFPITFSSRTTNGTLLRTTYHGGSLSGTLFAGVSAPSTTSANLDITYTSNGGDYNISTNTVNGITFSGTENIISAAGGRKIISLYASGTPIFKGLYTFNTNTTPSMSFTVNMDGEASTNGSAIISSFALGGSTGTITHPVAVSGVSQTITVNVTKLGNYNISANTENNNGVTYSAIGTFTQLGVQDITLNASGTPISTGTYNYTINTSPNVTFSRNVISQSSNGIAVYTSWSPVSSSGSLFVGGPEFGANTQTIRANMLKSGTINISTNTVNGITFSAAANTSGFDNPNTLVLTASGTPTNPGTFDYTINTTPSFTFSRTVSIAEPSSNGSAIISSIIFGGQSGLYNSGVPFVYTADYWVRYLVNASKAGWYNISSVYNGVTFNGYGDIPIGESFIQLYGTGTPTILGDFFPVLNVSNVTGNAYYKATVLSNPSTLGNGVISSFNSTSPNGTMIRGVPVSGVSQTHNVTVTRIGSYNLSNSNNGVTFAASGTFTSTGNQNIQFNATGTPTNDGNSSFSFGVVPVLSFNRAVVHNSSNGTAIFSAPWTLEFAGNMRVGENVSGVTHTIRVIRGRSDARSYNISATANGVTFSASGIDPGGPINSEFDIWLTASGIPTAAGNITFNTNTNPVMTFTRTIDP
jgi:uncharacterized protein (TIGR02145 family)